jgi:hypothetical protein
VVRIARNSPISASDASATTSVAISPSIAARTR